tara:strand:- start:489 stop:947 length:459 start_codon:yes stop_codon:yes gene_type:complete
LAKLDLNRQTAPEFIARLEKITSPSQRKWGVMEPEKLLCHLMRLVEISLGEKEAEKIFLPMPRFVLWIIFFNWFTNWPHGKLHAPDSFFPEPEEELEVCRKNCIDALERFVSRLESHPTQQGLSPLLGSIPLTKWARVHGVHMDHHLRQYGV